MSESHHEAMMALADRWFDEPLTAEQSAALAAWLAADGANLRYMADRGALNASIRHIARRRAAQSGDGGDRASAPATHRMFRRVGLAIAAGLLVAAAVTVAAYVATTGGRGVDGDASPASPVAVLTEAEGVAWVTEPIADGADLRPGEIAFDAGSVGIQMRGGADVRIVGPARFTLTGRTGCDLRLGRLTARVDHGSGGMIVDAPGGVRVTDVGTEFGVIVDHRQRVDVVVFDGTVELATPRERRQLTVGDAGAVEAGAVSWSHTSDAYAYWSALTGPAAKAVELGGAWAVQRWQTVADRGPVIDDDGVVRFDGPEEDRRYVRTLRGDWLERGFVAEVSVTVRGKSSGGAFVGVGVGLPSAELYGEPTVAPCVFARVFPTAFASRFAATDGDRDADQIMGGAGDGTHRLRMTYDAAARTIAFAIHRNYTGGPFVAAATLDPIDVSDNGFTDADAHLFFGGAGDATFGDPSFETVPKPSEIEKRNPEGDPR